MRTWYERAWDKNLKPSDTLLDVIADLAAEQSDEALVHGLKVIVISICLDSGMSEREVRRELEKRFRDARKARLNLQ